MKDEGVANQGPLLPFKATRKLENRRLHRLKKYIKITFFVCRGGKVNRFHEIPLLLVRLIYSESIYSAQQTSLFIGSGNLRNNATRPREA